MHDNLFNHEKENKDLINNNNNVKIEIIDNNSSN